MLYSIPVNRVEKLEKLIKKYQKKGANLSFEVRGDVVEEGTLRIQDPISHTEKCVSIKVACKEVFVDGSYQINGWSFVGVIDFTKNDNIIRLADDSFSGKIPMKYYSTPKICEHCGTIRNRKDTYLIYNEENNEWKQVGSTCLLEYTLGMDADMCASIMSCLDKVKNLGDMDFIRDEFFGNGYDSMGCGVEPTSLKRHAIALVKRYGYNKMFQGQGTAADLSNFYFKEGVENWDALFGSLTLASKEEVKEIDDYANAYLNKVKDAMKVAVETKDNSLYLSLVNTYMYNASLTWLKSFVEYRDFGLISSFVNTFLKEVKKAADNSAKANSQYQGNVGDRITIKINRVKSLYYKPSYSYYGAGTTVYELLDTNNNVYIWSTTDSLDSYFGHNCSWEDANGNTYSFMDKDGAITIKATVKEHKEYKGIKQTVITRGKVLFEGICKHSKEEMQVIEEKSKDACERTNTYINSILKEVWGD